MTNPKEALEWYERKRVEARTMADRDCNNCKHHKADGCSRWDCEYEPVMSDSISRQKFAKDTNVLTKDFISRTGAIAHFDKVAEELDEQRGDDSWVGNAFKICLLGVVNDLAALPSAEPPYQYSEAYVKQLRGERDILEEMVKNMAYRPTGWIPVIWHEITDEERNREGYPKDWVVYLDCEMPSDEQKILVTTRWGTVEADVCYEDGEFSLDSGWDWINDVLAWMPLPEPYREDGEA